MSPLDVCKDGIMLKMGKVTLQDVLRDHAFAAGEAPAIVSSKNNPLSYAGLCYQIDLVARALRDAGYGSESRIGISVSESPLAAVSIITVCCCATAVPIDPSLTSAEIEARLKLLNLDAIILRCGHNSPLYELAPRWGIPIFELVCANTRELAFDLKVAASQFVSSEPQNVTSDSIAVVLQTSGTTAEPKLVPYTHSVLLAAASRVQRWYELDRADRCLSVTPVHYCHGLTLTVMAPIITGGAV